MLQQDTFINDMNRILGCLRGGPMTATEMASILHLGMERIQPVIHQLAAQQIIRAPRCITDVHDQQIPLWEMKE